MLEAVFPQGDKAPGVDVLRTARQVWRRPAPYSARMRTGDAGARMPLILLHMLLSEVGTKDRTPYGSN